MFNINRLASNLAPEDLVAIFPYGDQGKYIVKGLGVKTELQKEIIGN